MPKKFLCLLHETDSRWFSLEGLGLPADICTAQSKCPGVPEENKPLRRETRSGRNPDGPTPTSGIIGEMGTQHYEHKPL